MAHTLKFSYGGSPYDLNSGSIILRSYVPQSPNLSTIDTNTILRDGGRRTLSSRRNVTESCTILVKSTSGCASVLETTKKTLQMWLRSAEKYNETGNSSPVYVQYAPDGLSASVYRSELLGGKVEISDDSLDTRWTKNRAVELNLTWTRKYYWEGDEITIPLFNSGCTSTCATVINQNPLDYTGQSGCWNNWVQIAASNVIGEIETPATIEIHSQNSGSVSRPEYRIFHGANENITSLPTTIEAESAVVWGATGSTFSSACYSSGSYRGQLMVESSNWGRFGYYALPSGSLEKWAGEYYAVMGVFEEDPPEQSFFGAIKLLDVSRVISISEGPTTEFNTTKHIQSFGSLRIPPNVIKADDYIEEQRMEVRIKNYSTAASLFIDAFYILPTDGYRHITQEGHTACTNDYIIDNGENDTVLFVDGDNNKKLTIMTWRGNPISLIPNKNQRLYLLHEEGIAVTTQAGCDPHRKHGIKVKYRPRRLTI